MRKRLFKIMKLWSGEITSVLKSWKWERKRGYSYSCSRSSTSCVLCDVWLL